MKKTIYRQCGLIRDLGNERTAGLVSYLPVRFAKMNRIVKLKQDDGQWEDGWKVVSVGAGVDADQTPDSHRAIKRHRDRTGDSLRR